MDSLGFDIQKMLPWFAPTQVAPYELVRLNEQYVRAWANVLGIAVRRCYITDALLEERAKKLGIPKSELLAAKLPDPGATMAGDFGEILVYLYHAARALPNVAIGPKKWQLKQDRTKPAPHSDVVHFVLPSWPTSSDKDILLCSEVKTKSTDGRSSPIPEAIEDCEKDRTSRLAKTLIWLRERALVEDLSDVSLAHLNRFINATDHPPPIKHFHAVAVICSSLIDKELAVAPTETPTGYSVVVLSVPELQRAYTKVFAAAHHSVAEPPPIPLSGGIR